MLDLSELTCYIEPTFSRQSQWFIFRSRSDPIRSNGCMIISNNHTCMYIPSNASTSTSSSSNRNHYFGFQLDVDVDALVSIRLRRRASKIPLLLGLDLTWSITNFRPHRCSASGDKINHVCNFETRPASQPVDSGCQSGCSKPLSSGSEIYPLISQPNNILATWM